MDKKDDTLTDKLNEIKELLEKESKYSYTYINKKKINTEIFFFDSFLITIKKNELQVFIYKEISKYNNTINNITIYFKNSTFIIEKNNIDKKFLTFLLELEKKYMNIIYNYQEKDFLWTRIEILFNNYLIKTYNIIDNDSLNEYYNIKIIKKINIMIFLILFLIMWPTVMITLAYIAYHLHFITIDEFFITVCIIQLPICFALSYKQYKINFIKNIFKRNNQGKIYLNNNNLILNTTNNIFLINSNDSHFYSDNNKYIFILFKKSQKLFIIKKEELTKKEIESIKTIFKKKIDL